MKMTQKHYQKLKKILDDSIKKIEIDKFIEHRKREKFMNERFRWDVFNICDSEYRRSNGTGIIYSLSLYDYLNDDNIDTALKKYVNEHFNL